MAKHILDAFIQQTLQFDTELEYEAYLGELKRGKLKFSIVSYTRDSDRKVKVVVRKQYNKNVFPDDVEKGGD